MKNNKLIWKISSYSVILIVIVLYGLILKKDIKDPTLFGFPFIMWVGMLATIILVALTIFAKTIFPFKED